MTSSWASPQLSCKTGRSCPTLGSLSVTRLLSSTPWTPVEWNRIPWSLFIVCFLPLPRSNPKEELTLAIKCSCSYVYRGPHYQVPSWKQQLWTLKEDFRETLSCLKHRKHFQELRDRGRESDPCSLKSEQMCGNEKVKGSSVKDCHS